MVTARELLAAAMDPSRSGGVRLSFITTVKQFDPLDVLVLKALYVAISPDSRVLLANSLQKPDAEIEISIQNLEGLGCVEAAL
jgi:hypothetical protein